MSIRMPVSCYTLSWRCFDFRFYPFDRTPVIYSDYLHYPRWIIGDISQY